LEQQAQPLGTVPIDSKPRVEPHMQVLVLSSCAPAVQGTAAWTVGAWGRSLQGRAEPKGMSRADRSSCKKRAGKEHHHWSRRTCGRVQLAGRSHGRYPHDASPALLGYPHPGGGSKGQQHLAPPTLGHKEATGRRGYLGVEQGHGTICPYPDQGSQAARRPRRRTYRSVEHALHDGHWVVDVRPHHRERVQGWHNPKGQGLVAAQSLRGAQCQPQLRHGTVGQVRRWGILRLVCPKQAIPHDEDSPCAG